ncbi:hypothetical protein G6F56_002511 [Rhizopus delemar]|nr:hypothetical protein G6F56_002511 [Rhizopus delemar]
MEENPERGKEQKGSLSRILGTKKAAYSVQIVRVERQVVRVNSVDNDFYAGKKTTSLKLSTSRMVLRKVHALLKLKRVTLL